MHVETVASVSNDTGNTLALDSKGHPHIFQYKSSNLLYAHYDGTSWHNESLAFPGGYVSVALDLNDKPHISYSASNTLKYSYNDGSDWHTWTIDTISDSYRSISPNPAFTAIALDKSGNPNIAYGELRYWYLKCAQKNDTDWKLDIVDKGFSLGSGKMALDQNNRPHIIYSGISGFNGELKYAFFNGITWQIENIENSSSTWYGDSSISIDSNGNPHVVFSTDQVSKYCYRDLSGWHMQSFAGALDFCSMAIDKKNNPHISYYAGSDLNYAQYDGTNWDFEAIDSAWDVGKYSSLILDPDDKPHISYYDITNGHLKYAFFNGTSWHIETVDSTTNAGQYCSIALDSNYNPHISCLIPPK